MAEKNKGPVIIVVIVVSIIAVAAFLAFLLFEGAAVDDARGPRTSSPAEAGQTSRPAPSTPPAVVVPPTAEEEDERIRAQVIESARAVNDGNDPIPCESVCDCPQGMDCQMGSQRCLPSPFPTYCCDKEGCPEGEACRHEDGRYGNCSEE